MRNPAFLWLRLASFSAAALVLTAPAQAQQPQEPAPQAQSPSPQDSGSVADAANRSRTQTTNSTQRKVYANEDMASLAGSVSVVGEEKTSPPIASAQSVGAKPYATAVPSQGKQDESYWRNRYQALRLRMDAIDRQIEQVQQDMQKRGNTGFDTTTGASKNTIYIVDRRSQLKELQRRKAAIQKEIDDLQDEARRAGVPPSWVR